MISQVRACHTSFDPAVTLLGVCPTGAPARVQENSCAKPGPKCDGATPRCGKGVKGSISAVVNQTFVFPPKFLQ